MILINNQNLKILILRMIKKYNSIKEKTEICIDILKIIQQFLEKYYFYAVRTEKLQRKSQDDKRYINWNFSLSDLIITQKCTNDYENHSYNIDTLIKQKFYTGVILQKDL